MAVCPYVSEKHEAGLDVSDARNFRDLGDRSIVKSSRRLSVGFQARTAVAAVVVAARRISLAPGGNQIANVSSKHLDLVEEVERFETREHVSLQAKPEGNHGDDYRHADDDAHGREY